MTTEEKKKVALISGDGIGPEISHAATEIIDATGAQIEWVPVLAGAGALEQGMDIMPTETLTTIAKCAVAYKGPIATPIGSGHSSANVHLRKHFKLFANVRPVKNLPGIHSRYENIDIIVIRENTEDLYAGLEHTILPGVVECLKIITADASERIARFSFELCRRQGRKRVTSVHKANIMKLSDGLFIKTIRKVHKEYSDIEYDEIIVDNLCNQLVLRPETFDVLLTTNLYGDILSDLCAGLVGGLGVVPGANYGEDCAIFEAVHGTAPDIAGKGIANPSAMLLSGCLMLDYLGFNNEAKKIRSALDALFTVGGNDLTSDLGGKASTKDFSQSIINEMNKG